MTTANQCTNCQGTGEVCFGDPAGATLNERNPSACPVCDGTGQVWDARYGERTEQCANLPCSACEGTGTAPVGNWQRSDLVACPACAGCQITDGVNADGYCCWHCGASGLVTPEFAVQLRKEFGLADGEFVADRLKEAHHA